MSEISNAFEAVRTALDELQSAVEGDNDAANALYDIIGTLEEAGSSIFRTQDNLPSRYTEIGNVADLADCADSHLRDAELSVKRAIDALRDLHESLS